MKTRDKFFGQAWYIRPTSWEFLAHHLAAETDIRPARSQDRPIAARPTEDFFGDPLGQMRMEGSLAIVPVFGPMLKGATPFEQWYYGFCAHENIAADLAGAVSNGAKAILMHVNSPGGSVTGTPELADQVSAIVQGGVPVFSFTEDLQCSAAEYITGACSLRLATGSAIVGSIGTMLETRSFAKFLDRIGISYNIFASGKYKAMGHPAKDLTPEQATFLQDFVDGRAAEFKAHMTQFRPGIAPEAMQGQIFTGHQGAQNGLIDALVSGLPEAIRLCTPSRS